MKGLTVLSDTDLNTKAVNKNNGVCLRFLNPRKFRCSIIVRIELISLKGWLSCKDLTSVAMGV